jgi:hypothetical protein
VLIHSLYPRIAAAALVLTCTMPALAGDAPIRKLFVDPDARRVELFEAIDEGLISVRIVPRDELQSQFFVSNKTDEPLTVEFPRAVAAVPVLKQFGQNPFGQNPFGQGNNQQNGQNQANRNNAAQSIGGQIGASGQQMQNQAVGQGIFNINSKAKSTSKSKAQGGGFCSIPPEKTVQLEIQSVCLDHGKKTPTSKMIYELRPIEEHAKDPALVALFENVDMRSGSRPAIQAAAWNIQNGLPLQQLLRETISGRHEPYGAGNHLQHAQQLITASRQVAKEGNPAPETPVQTSQTASTNPRTRTSR